MTLVSKLDSMATKKIKIKIGSFLVLNEAYEPRQ